MLHMLGKHPQFGTKTDHANMRRRPMTEYQYAIFYLIDWQEDAIDVVRAVDGGLVRDRISPFSVFRKGDGDVQFDHLCLRRNSSN